RSVTLAPMAMPWRSLNWAMDFRARVMAAFCPVIWARSATAASSSLPSRMASPTPMLSTIFSRRGTRMGLSMPRSCMSRGRISSRYRALSRGGGEAWVALVGRSSLISCLRAAVAADADLGPGLFAVADPGRLAALTADQHHVGQVDEQLGLDDPALL